MCGFQKRLINPIFSGSDIFRIVELLLGYLGTIVFLTASMTQFLPKKAEASAIASLEQGELTIPLVPKKQDPKKTSKDAITADQVGQLTKSSPVARAHQQKRQRLELKLKDAVAIALQHNRTLKNAYLDRIIQQNNLQEAQAKFVPNFIPQLRVSLSRDRVGTSSTNREDLELGAAVSVRIPTGGELRADWTGAGRSQNSSINNISSPEDSLRQDFSVSFNQPFLRGFGNSVSKAPINIARLEEQQNIFQIKLTLIDTITSAVIDYRALVQAQEELKIQQQALASAKRQLEITQAFIDAGRRARVDLIQNQTAVANREVDLLAAENRLAEAQLQLLQTLDIDRNLDLVASETPIIEKSVPLDPTKVLKSALANNPDYLSTSLNIEIAQLNLLLAEDNRRWDLSLNVSYENSLNSISDDSSGFSSSLNLSREFVGNLRLDRDVIRSQVTLQQAQNNLEEARATLEIQVQNSIREVNFRITEIERARRATQLSRQQLESEREKLKLGRGSIFDAITFEDDLVNAANRELNAVIAYLNALTNLEQTIGSTLKTWNVTIEDR